MVEQFNGAKTCARFCSCWSKIAIGIFRQLASGCVLFSFLGWVILAVGFGIQVRGLDLSARPVRNLLGPYWCSLVTGPIAFILAGLHILLGYRFPSAGNVIGAFATLANLLYAATLSGPIFYTALFIFGASSFGDFEDVITELLPVSNVINLIGLDSDILDTIVGLVALVYERAEDGIEFVVDRILSIPSSREFDALVRAQFSGCVISLFFLALSMVFWPLYSKPESYGPRGQNNRVLNK